MRPLHILPVLPPQPAELSPSPSPLLHPPGSWHQAGGPFLCSPRGLLFAEAVKEGKARRAAPLASLSPHYRKFPAPVPAIYHPSCLCPQGHREHIRHCSVGASRAPDWLQAPPSTGRASGEHWAPRSMDRISHRAPGPEGPRFLHLSCRGSRAGLDEEPRP